MSFDSRYILKAKIWFEKANNIKDTSDDQVYCKFFFLWNNFILL